MPRIMSEAFGADSPGKRRDEGHLSYFRAVGG
jgi:hypothetical protein